jgi:glutamate dehydrogenase/leucine dehydrogenase
MTCLKLLKTLRENSSWTEEQVNTRLEQQLSKAFQEIWHASQKLNLDLKQASFAVALAKIAGKTI